MTERKKPLNLTLDEERKLVPLIARMESQRKHEADNVFLVSISSRTVNELKYLLNMNDGKDTSYRSQEDTPFYKAVKITEDYLNYFSQDEKTMGTRSMHDQVGRWVEATFPKDRYRNYKLYHDAATIGLFLVFKAFSIESGSDFVEDFKKIDPKEVEEAFNVLGPQVKDGSSLIERSRNKVKISDDQVFLKSLITEFVDFYSGYYGPQVESGASLGFGVVEKLWPKLKSGESKRI